MSAGPRLGPRLGPGPPLTMAITGRVPLLLPLGLVPVVLRPPWAPCGSGCWSWPWWSARTRLLAPSRRRPGDPRRRHRTGPAGRADARRRSWWPTRAPPVRGVVRDAWQPTAGAREQPAPAPADAPATASCCTRRSCPVAAATCAHAASRSAPGGRSAWPPASAPPTSRARCGPLPPFESRKHLPSRLARLRDLDGRSAVRMRGQGTEFDSLREYVRGDDVRSIDWRATRPQPQRRGAHLAARARPARRHRAGHLAHLGRPHRRRAAPRLRHGRRPAAGRPRGARRRPHRLPGRRPPGAGPGARRGPPRHRGQPPGHDGRPRARDRRGRLGDPGRRRQPRSGASARSSCCSPRWSPRPSRRACSRSCPRSPSTTASCSPPSRTPRSTGSRRRRSTVEEVYGAAAAEQVLARRRGTADLLRALGVDVVDAVRRAAAPGAGRPLPGAQGPGSAVKPGQRGRTGSVALLHGPLPAALRARTLNT